MKESITEAKGVIDAAASSFGVSAVTAIPSTASVPVPSATYTTRPTRPSPGMCTPNAKWPMASSATVTTDTWATQRRSSEVMNVHAGIGVPRIRLS